MTLTDNLTLGKVKVNSHNKTQGYRSNGSAVRVLMHRHTDGQKDASLPADLENLENLKSVDYVTSEIPLGKC